MGYPFGARGKVGQSADDAIHAFETKHWAVVFGILFLPPVLQAVTPWMGYSSHQHIVLAEWAYPLALIVLLTFTANIWKGSYAKLATKRMWAPTGTPMWLLALLPVVLWLTIVGIQAHGLDHAVLLTNVFSYDYKGTVYLFSLRYWLEVWSQTICSSIAHLWVLVLVLSASNQKLREILIGSFLIASFVLSFANQLVIHRFYPGTMAKHQFYAPSLAWWIVDSAVSLAATWIIYRMFERAFRPSLLPVVAMVGTEYLYSMMFESPSGPYRLVCLVLQTVIIWACLRNSKFGTEKWSEYQHSLEVTQA